MTTADPLVGATLDGRYFVESRIAGGGMAAVYVAHDHRLGRKLALKVMHASLASDPLFVRRFINEAHSVAKLSHPNVVQVFDQGTDKGHVYLAMEFIEGRTMRDLLNARGRLPARDALQLMAPVLAALGAAHRAGLVHRDVKPENVLLTADGRVKVADFGLARATESANQGLTSTGTLMGTAGYLAPEQITEGRADSRSDVYAAGIMFYELLTGEQPYHGDSPLAIAYQHVNDNVPAPSTRAHGVPREVDTLVEAATEHDPDHRPADAGRFLALVLEILGPMPETGPNVPLTYAPAAKGTDPRSEDDNHTLVVNVDPADLAPARGSGRNSTREPAWRDPRRLPLIIIGAVVAVALLVFGWWMLLGRYEEVPAFVGMSEKQALKEAQSAGLRLKINEDPVYSDNAEKDEIAEVTPGVGESVLPGTSVTVSLSKGPQSVEMPDVIGERQDNARTILEDAGITKIKTEKKDSVDKRPGTVLASDPRAKSDADREKTVTLTVAAGFDVPDVTDMGEDEARRELEGKGLKVDVVEKESDDVDKGTVMAQDPKKGSNVSKGETVTITVSSGPAKVKVPDIKGWNVGDAERKLKDLGFKVKVHQIFGDKVGEYNPKGEARKGAEIEIWTSPIGDEGDDRGRGRDRDRDD